MSESAKKRHPNAMKTAKGRANSLAASKGIAPADRKIERHRRCERAAAMLASGYSVEATRLVLRDEYGITWSAAQRYITDAGQLVLDALDKPIEYRKGLSLRFYEDLKQRPDARVRDLIGIQQRIDCLLGLEPQQQASNSATINNTVNVHYHTVKQDGESVSEASTAHVGTGHARLDYLLSPVRPALGQDATVDAKP